MPQVEERRLNPSPGTTPPSQHPTGVSPLSSSPRRTVKARDLAREIGEWLAQSGIQPGTRIGDRAAMANTWRVSESTMREAVRILEAAGLVEQRVGVGGGVFFAPNEAGAIAEILMWSVRLGRADQAELLETLAELEVLIAARVAQLANSDQIRSCEEAARATGTFSDPSLSHSCFHEVMAASAGNRVVALLRGALAAAVTTQAAGMRAAGNKKARDPDHVTYSHSHIVDALRSRDGAEAARRMRRHIRIVLESDEDQEVTR